MSHKLASFTLSALLAVVGSINVFAQDNRVRSGDTEERPQSKHNPLNPQAQPIRPQGEVRPPRVEQPRNTVVTDAKDDADGRADAAQLGRLKRPPTEIVVPAQPPKNVRPTPVQVQDGKAPQALVQQAAVVVTRQNYPVGGKYTGTYVAPAGVSYYTGFYFGGFAYNPAPFFAANAYSPTQWFYYGSGAWYSPGAGWQYQPPVYRGPITIVVQETIVQTVWNPVLRRNVTVVRSVVFYYNAYWYNAARAYGYYDYAGRFHWVRW